MKNKNDAKSESLLSIDYRQVLLQQVFDDDGPGTILHDFEKILDFIGPDGIGVGGKYKFFPIKFDVKLERIDPADKKIKGPFVLESHGEAPDQYSDWDDY